MTVDVLRNVLFQRGGLPTDVVLKIQEITVVTDVTDKDLVAEKQSLQSSRNESRPTPMKVEHEGQTSITL